MFTDSLQIADGSMRRTEDGYLAATALVARGGNVQRYTGAEMGEPEREYVDVYRPEDEVFSKGTMQSAASRPITNDHPPEQVTADNWKIFAAGYSGEDVARDGDMLRTPLLMTDAASISDYEKGKVELSAGYTADIEWADGYSPEGVHYDAVQRNIRMNHYALVSRARAEGARIGDRHTPLTTVPHHQEGITMPDTRTVVVDGLSIDTTDQGAQAIDKLQKQIADAETARTELADAHKAALDAKDAELAKKDGELDELKKQVMTDEQLDAAVTERADLLAKAKTVHDADYAGKAPADIRKAVVAAVLGDEAVKDKSEAYVEARFDVLAEQSDKADPVRAAIGTNDAALKDNGQADYEARLTDAWKIKEASNG